MPRRLEILLLLLQNLEAPLLLLQNLGTLPLPLDQQSLVPQRQQALLAATNQALAQQRRLHQSKQAVLLKAKVLPALIILFLRY